MPCLLHFGDNAFRNDMDPFILPPYLWGKYQIRLVSVTFGENQSKKRKTDCKRVKKVPGNYSTIIPMKEWQFTENKSLESHDRLHLEVTWHF